MLVNPPGQGLEVGPYHTPRWWCGHPKPQPLAKNGQNLTFACPGTHWCYSWVASLYQAMTGAMKFLAQGNNKHQNSFTRKDVLVSTNTFKAYNKCKGQLSPSTGTLESTAGNPRAAGLVTLPVNTIPGGSWYQATRFNSWVCELKKQHQELILGGKYQWVNKWYIDCVVS